MEFAPAPAPANRHHNCQFRTYEFEFLFREYYEYELKSKLRKAVFWHKVSHSRAKISKELAQLPKFTKWPAQCRKAVWQNPKNGEEALYIASHVHKINGLNCTDVDKFVEELVTFCTQPK